jgi:hypothetical protein
MGEAAPSGATRMVHSFTLDAACDRVADHLLDADSYVGLTPFVVAVRGADRDAHGLTYTAVERFRLLGLIRVDNPIAVTLDDAPAQPAGVRMLHGRVKSPGGVRLEYSYRLEDVGGGSTRMVDDVTLTAPAGLRRFAASRAREAQLYRGDELARRFA